MSGLSVLAGLVSCGFFCGLQTAVFSLCPHMGAPLWVCVNKTAPWTVGRPAWCQGRENREAGGSGLSLG